MAKRATSTKTKVKQIAFIGGVSLLTAFVFNSLAKRSQLAATVQQKIASGL